MIMYYMGGFCMAGAVVYGWKDTYDEKINLTDWKNHIVFIGLALLLGINYTFSNKYLRFLIVLLLLFISNLCLFRKSVKNTVLSTIATQVVGIISELIFALCTLSFTTILPEQVQETFFGAFITNFMISSFIIVLAMIHLPKYIYLKINRQVPNKLHIQDFLSILLLIVSINTLFVGIYYKISMIALILISSAIMIVYAYIIINSKKIMNDKLQVYEKYKKTTQSLDECQKIIDDFHMNSHEITNQMKNMKSMIDMQHTDAEKYFKQQITRKEVISQKIDEDKKKVLLLNNPLGIAIQEKCNLMEKYKIKYQLELDKLVKASDLIDIDSNTMLDICDIINVFLDNAIEAIKKVEHGKIRIRIYKEQETLKVSIANTCKELIDIKKIEQKKYSTKGDGRGYGLALVNEIIKSNLKLKNEKKWSNGLFIQILEIK